MDASASRPSVPNRLDASIVTVMPTRLATCRKAGSSLAGLREIPSNVY
jgi:hypothetical protein